MRKIGLFVDKENNQIEILLFDHAIENPQIAIPASIRQKLNRPDLTPDELEQIRYDFSRLDIMEKGFIKPNIILQFIENNSAFLNNNPVYSEALRNINTIENNESGINVNVLIDAIIDLIKKLDKKDWDIFYNLYLRASEQYEFNFNALKTVSNELGYEANDSELKDVYERLLGNKKKWNKDDFVTAMMIMHKTYRPETI